MLVPRKLSFGLGVLALVPLAAVPLVHCGNGKAPNPIGEDAGTATFAYQGAGCQYVVTPPASRGFLDLALDDATAPSDPTQAVPMRVRTGLGGGTTKGQPGYADPTTTVAFTWETAISTTNAKVKMGASPSALTTVHTGYSFTSPPPQAGLGSTDPSEYVHEVHVCGLTPGTTYYYQVGGGASGSEIWSATQSFTTVPVLRATARRVASLDDAGDDAGLGASADAGLDAGSGDAGSTALGDAGNDAGSDSGADGGSATPADSIVVGIFGDARDTVGTWQLVHERMRGVAPSLMLVSGDIVDLGVEESLFSQWLTAIWKDPTDASKFITLGQFIMVPIGGNHENDSSQFYANFAIPGGGDYAEQYASFDVGNAHFVLVDDTPIANQETDPMNVELAWLDADLAAANADRAKHPFIVAVSHRGVFSTSNHATDSDVLLTRGLIVPLFDKYHVDLVMNGHDHEYERSLPLNAGNPASGAPVVKSSLTEGTTYVINAGAGADPYAVGTYPSTYRAGKPTALGSQGGNKYVGCYTLLTLHGSTMTLDAYGMKASGGSTAGDDVIDTLTFGQ